MSTLYRYDEDDVPRAAALDGGAGPEPSGAESDEDIGEPEPSRAIRGCLIGLGVAGAIGILLAAAGITVAAMLGAFR